MKRMEQCVLTNMCLVRRGDEILVQLRTKKDWPGITLPGGHAEKGEGLSQAVIREVYEETGLTIRHPRLCGIEEFKTEEEDRYFVFFYVADEFEGELKDSAEGRVFWIKRADLEKYELSYDLMEIMEVIENDQISELRYFMENGEWKSVYE